MSQNLSEKHSLLKFNSSELVNVKSSYKCLWSTKWKVTKGLIWPASHAIFLTRWGGGGEVEEEKERKGKDNVYWLPLYIVDTFLDTSFVEQAYWMH